MYLYIVYTVKSCFTFLKRLSKINVKWRSDLFSYWN